MNQEVPSGKIRPKNEYASDADRFTDADRRAIQLDPKLRTALGPARFLRALTGDEVNEFLPSEERGPLSDFLHNVAQDVLKTNKIKYPFLTQFGDESFDQAILIRTIRTFDQYLQKKPRGRNYGTPTSKEFQPKLGDSRQLARDIDNVYKFHIPAYTDMFAELDTRQASQEIFLGRDAVFMYYARRAQLWGRGESGKKAVCINYSTSIRQVSFTKEERARYLRGKGITDVTNAVFIDTGYNGTMPDHIMHQVFGITDAQERNKRILLIEANQHTRQARRSGSRMSGEVSEIEASPMPTQSAEGLYEDEKSGKLEPYAAVNGAMDILRHECIKYLCMRHFYLQGRTERGKTQK